MITTIANFARFVIADVSDPDTVRDTLSVIIPNAPTVPIQLIADLDVIVNDSMNWKSHSSILSECTSWESYPSVLPVYWYADLSQLLANLTESVITPVEAHVQARRL